MMRRTQGLPPAAGDSGPPLSPDLQRWWPPSFRQLLLLAFAGIILVLGGALARTLVVVHSLNQSVAAYPAMVLRAVEGVRELQELTVSLEREARLYLVLNDAGIRHSLQQDWTRTQAVATQLQQTLAQWPDLGIEEWQTQGAALLTPLLVGASPFTIDSSALFDGFRAVAEHNRIMRQQVNQILNERTQSLLQELEQQRAALLILGIAAASLSIGLALVLGGWLAGALRTLNRAIGNLALSPPGPSCAVRGPRDFRALGERIEAVRAQLLALETDKRQFLRHISHELKTPLSNLREGIALLNDQVAGVLTLAQQEILTILADNAHALQQQIEGLLQYNAATFHGLQLKRQPVALRALLQALLERQRLLLQNRKLETRIVGPEQEMLGDHEKLDMLLGNLLSNAIRFSPAQGLIEWTVEPREAEKSLWIECRDQGPGVAPEDRERIFEPFVQGARQPEGARKGSGVGLSIVRELARAHGGSVHLLDAPGGAAFRVVLPLHH